VVLRVRSEAASDTFITQRVNNVDHEMRCQMSIMCADLDEETALTVPNERGERAPDGWDSATYFGRAAFGDPTFVHFGTAGASNLTDIGPDESAAELLFRVAERLTPTDARLAREVYLEAISLEISRGRGAQLGSPGKGTGFPPLPPLPRSPQATDLALEGLVRRYRDGYSAGLSQLSQALDAFTNEHGVTDRSRWRRLMACIAMDLWDDERWQCVASVALDGAGSGGPDAGGAQVDPNLGIVVSSDFRSISMATYAKAVICNGLGRYEEAREAARWAVERDDLGFSGWALSELVEAAARSGRADVATRALAALRHRAQSSGTHLALGIGSRGSALLSEGKVAESHYQQSVEHLERTLVRVHLARSRLVYGEWLRREGRRVDARAQLRAAETMFNDIRANAFAERTRRELQATGETVHKRTYADFSELTPQEDQIARLASSRLTNSEIGTQLYISPRTVEWHLRKIFRKLGVTSRRELRFS
jgi:DNA-binding CsgD family transcriptional regulator